MQKRPFLIAVAISAIIFIALTIVVWVRMSPYERASDSLKSLPKCSEYFPSHFALSDIRYRYEPWTTELLMFGTTTPKQVEDLCSAWKCNLLKYGKWNGQMDYSRPFATFNPKAGHVWIAFAKLPHSGRMAVWMYFEPGNDNGSGKLYIHFVR